MVSAILSLFVHGQTVNTDGDPDEPGHTVRTASAHPKIELPNFWVRVLRQQVSSCFPYS